MEWYVILILVVGVILGISMVIGILNRWSDQSRRRKILVAFRRFLPDAVIGMAEGQPWDYSIETETTLYLVKRVVINPYSELIVTNPDYWCINDQPDAWKRSSTPNLVPGVRNFRQSAVKSLKTTVKLGLIDPNCRTISCYRNESEVELVKPDTMVHGMHLVRFDALADFFSNVEKKQFTKIDF